MDIFLELLLTYPHINLQIVIIKSFNSDQYNKS